jgi:predicted phage terminase large subunit-like protein
MGRTMDGKFYVLDVERFQKGPAGVQAAVKRVAKSDGYDVPILIEQERAGAGKSTIETYQTLLVGHRVDPAKADGTKQSRATPYSAEQNKGNVLLPKDAPWLSAWIDEHRRMSEKRKPRHDDQIDTGAYAILELIDAGPVEIYDPSGSNFDAPSQMEQLLALYGAA